jgi:co-chaperonin GroES (HSP10)
MADETPINSQSQPRIDPYKVRALGTHVLVKLDEVPDKIGSIIVPDGSYERSECWAIVVSPGTGIDTKKGRIPLDFKKDDRVMVIRMQALVESNKQTQADMGDGVIWLNYPYDFLLVQEE